MSDPDGTRCFAELERLKQHVLKAGFSEKTGVYCCQALSPDDVQAALLEMLRIVTGLAYRLEALREATK